MATTRSDANSTEKERYALGFAPTGTSVCVLCNEKCYRDLPATHEDSFQLGHVVSDAHGGRFEWSNLAPMCRGCNVTLGKVDADTERFHYNPWERYELPAAQAASKALGARREARGRAIARKLSQWL